MGAVNDLNAGNLGEIWRAIRQLQAATPLNSASIGAGGLRVYNGGMITIENGGLRVTGTAEIIGELLASGVIDFTGEVNISGPLDVSGLTTLMADLTVASGGRILAGSIELNPDGSAKFGTMTISPAGKITSGAAEINPDGSAKFGSTEISAAGKVTMGGMELDPATLGGQLKFSNSTYLAATPNGAQLSRGDSAAYVSSSQAGIAKAGVGVGVDSSGPFISGMPTTTQPANLYQDPATGRIYRSTA